MPTPQATSIPQTQTQTQFQTRRPTPVPPGRTAPPVRKAPARPETLVRAKPAIETCLPPAPPAPPTVPVAATAVEAVATALKGEAVKLPLKDAEPQTLAIRELIPRGDLRAFEAAIGGKRFEIVAPEAIAADQVLGKLLPMVAQIPPAVRDQLRRVTVKDVPAPGVAYVIELAAPNNKLWPITVARTSTTADKAVYEIKDAQGRFELVTVPDEQDAWEVAQAFHLWAQIPTAMRGALQTITVENGANPTDAEWAVKYNRPDFASAATGGNGQATFWRGTQYLREEFFLHEFGHVLGQTYSTKNDMIPDDWAEAITADNRQVTEYSTAAPAEDFAESFWIYTTLRNGGTPRLQDGPTTLEEFQTRWPKRAAILNAIFSGERRPAGKAK